MEMRARARAQQSCLSDRLGTSFLSGCIYNVTVPAFYFQYVRLERKSREERAAELVTSTFLCSRERSLLAGPANRKHTVVIHSSIIPTSTLAADSSYPASKDSAAR